MIYVFGDFEISTERYELCRKGIQIQLRPKSLDILIYLIQNRSRMVTHDELIWGIWGIERTEFFSRTALSNCIKEIRNAIGDSGWMQKSIRTVHGRGYRFQEVVSEYTEELYKSDKATPVDYGVKAIEEKAFTTGMDFVEALERYKYTLHEGIPDEGLSHEFHKLLSKIEQLIGPLISEVYNTEQAKPITP